MAIKKAISASYPLAAYDPWAYPAYNIDTDFAAWAFGIVIFPNAKRKFDRAAAEAAAIGPETYRARFPPYREAQAHNTREGERLKC